MVNGIPDEPPDWVLKGGLAHLLAPHLGLRPHTDHPLALDGLMQITYENHRLSREAPLKSIAGTRIEPSGLKFLSSFTLRFLRK